MAALIGGGTCACVICAFIVSLIIYALGERTHTKIEGQEHIFFSICDTSFTSHVRNPSNDSLYNTDYVMVILADSLWSINVLIF